MADPLWFEYGHEEMAWLGKKDKKLGAIIGKAGYLRRVVHPEPFPSLLRTVIGQQISGKAQESVWGRFSASCAPISPAHVAGLDIGEMRACGLSLNKAQNISLIAREFASGSLKDVDLAALSDDELAAKLVGLRGIGPWTVEMLLIFTFQRKNILSFGDLGIQKGLMRLHGHRKIDRALFARYHKRYSPYATIASFYLWEIASGNV